MKTQNSVATTTCPNTVAGRLRTACATRLLPLLMLLLLTLPGAVQAQDCYTCTTNNGTITIMGYTCTNGVVTIPSSINGLPVTSIGEGAFQEGPPPPFHSCTLTSVTIPNSVTNIGDGAFAFCTGLTSLTIGTNVTSIGEDAFGYCTKLTSVTIPNSVTSIGDRAFSDCSSLTAITVDTNNPAYSSLDGVLFNKSQTTLVEYPGSIAGSYTIPDSVTSIGDWAFNDCYSLTSVTIPDSVTTIGDGAFDSCTSLTNAIIGNGVTSIGGDAFQDCGLTSVTIGNSVTNIGGWAFDNCRSLTSLTIPNSVTSLGDYAFRQCNSLTSVTIPNSVTSIGIGAFYYCTGLKSVMIGNGVTSIGYAAFASCANLTGVYFQGNAPSADSTVFYGDNNVTVYYLLGTTGWEYFAQLTGVTTVLLNPPVPYNYTTNNGTITITAYTGSGGDVTIPDTITGLPVTSIGDYAFQSPSLTSVTIPNSVTSIGYEAFTFCTSLGTITVNASNSVYSSVGGVLFDKSQTTLIEYPGGKAGSYTIPNSVTNIGDEAFFQCSSLTSVAISNSVINIGDEAFYYCSSLTNVTIPSSVTSIGRGTFWNCTSLTSVTIPNSVSNIRDLAFCDCYSLTSVTIPNSVTNIGDYCFELCDSLTNVTIGNNVTSIGEAAFCNCTSLTSVTIPKSVTSIGDQAFYYCTELTGVYFKGNAPSLGSDVFDFDNNATVYYLPGTTGWGATTYGGRPAVLLNPPVPYNYTTNNGTITITGYTGDGGDVTIPDTINGLPVTSIDGVIGVHGFPFGAFEYCTSLTSVTIPDSVTYIGNNAFECCTSLTSVTIGNSVARIGQLAFAYCDGLTSVTIPKSVAIIVNGAFDYCTSLTGVYFQGNAPIVGEPIFFGASLGWNVSANGDLLTDLFYGDTNATVYYLPGTTGWDSTFGGCPTALWFLPNPLILNNGSSFGVQTNGFGFIISWATNASVAVEACTNLANPAWSSLQTNTLTGGWSYFSDPQWTNYPGRFYRLRSP